jgi:hypothetical protein
LECRLKGGVTVHHNYVLQQTTKTLLKSINVATQATNFVSAQKLMHITDSNYVFLKKIIL